MDDDDKQIKNVSLEQSTDDYNLFSSQAEIKFRNRKFETKIKNIMKVVIFILIASISGGITATIIIDIKYSNILYSHFPFVISQVTTIRNSDNTRSTIGRVADIVQPALVGISDKEENFNSNTLESNSCGVVFDSRGYILTSYDGVKDFSNIYVKFPNKPKVIKAIVVGTNPYADIAILKVSLQGLQTISFGDSSKVRMGDTVLALGNSCGTSEGIITSGIVSATDKTLNDKNSYKIILTDAAITSENYGGFLCNEEGNVIAINLKKYNTSLQFNSDEIEGALAINEAQDLIKKIMDNNNISMNSNPNIVLPKVDFGVEVCNSDLNDKNSIKGIYVKEVHLASSASKAGIKVLDIIIELDKQKIASTDDFYNILSKHKPGDVIPCKVLREGKVIELNVSLYEAK
ncbi:MAG: S1C family serine protease [Bacillota bacterium]|nr:S1C family serine protease [Bacillota bacterium]